MVRVLDWQGAQDAGPLLAEVVDSLAKGRLVGVPTETVYGITASALIPEAIERLASEKGRPAGKPLTLAIRDAREALDWVPTMSLLGRRLARRCWPGPLTLVCRIAPNGGLLEHLPQPVKLRVCPNGTLGMRAPDHPAMRGVLSSFSGPLVLTSANRTGEPPATTAGEAMEAVGAELALIVDGGPSRLGRPSTVVVVEGSSWRILREGALSSVQVAESAACRILFVCTGNTCRSPMAAALCSKLLAGHLGCQPEELLEQGFLVQSAGVAAMMGAGAAPEAQDAVKELGADLANHQTQSLTEALVEHADYLIVMTRSHLNSVAARFGGVGPSPRVLSREQKDLPDPVGCDRSVYRHCASEIERHVAGLIPEIVVSNRVVERPEQD